MNYSLKGLFWKLLYPQWDFSYFNYFLVITFIYFYFLESYKRGSGTCCVTDYIFWYLLSFSILLTWYFRVSVFIEVIWWSSLYFLIFVFIYCNIKFRMSFKIEIKNISFKSFRINQLKMMRNILEFVNLCYLC